MSHGTPGNGLRLMRIASVLSILAEAVTAGCSPSVHAPVWRLVPEETGLIRHVVCTVNVVDGDLPQNGPAVRSIVAALPDHARVTIVTKRPSLAVTQDALESPQVDFLEFPENRPLTIWPQDAFLVLTAAGRTGLLVPYPHAADPLAEHLVSQLGWDIRRSRLSFEGGNVVGTSDRVFIGADTVGENAQRLNVSEHRIVRQLERELGLPVVTVGPSPQPIPHLDLFFTPLPARRAVVADVAWGRQIARDALGEIRGQLDVDKISPPSDHLAAYLEQIAAQLRHLGYEVFRMPLLLEACRDAPSPQAGETSVAASRATSAEPCAKWFPCLSYNNVLIEEGPESSQVYLPQYGWPAMDREARVAWERSGCRVIPVDGMLSSAMLGGSLRCCAKVVARRD